MRKELSILGQWTHTGTLAANTEWQPSAASGNAELDTDELAEVLYLEITPPVLPDGTIEPLEHVWPVLDETPIREYVNLCGRKDALMGPRMRHTYEGMIVPFGMGIVDSLHRPNPAPGLTATTLKYKDKLRIIARAGATDITQPFTITAWGYRYTEEELARILSAPEYSPVLNPSVTINDRGRGRVFSLSKAPIQVNAANWDRLPGGAKQEKPIIMPFFRWSRNAKATTVNMEYQFRYDIVGNVDLPEMDLYFTFDIKAKALLVKGLGVRAATNLKYTWINLSADTLHKEHPKGKLLTTVDYNPLHFGMAYPFWPADLPMYYAIPRFAGDDLLIYKELGYIAIQDNGTQVAANSVYVAINGVLFEMAE